MKRQLRPPPEPIPSTRAARRAATAESDEIRECVWFVQWQSSRPGGLSHLANQLVDDAGENVGPLKLLSATGAASDPVPSKMAETIRTEAGIISLGAFADRALEERFGPELPRSSTTLGQLRREVADFVRRALPHYLRSWASGEEGFFNQETQDPAPAYWPGLATALRSRIESHAAEHRQGFAMTAVARIVIQELDFAFQRRASVLMWGKPRTGKSTAARAYCMMYPGRARFVEAGVGESETEFLHLIARAVGLGGELEKRASELRRGLNDTFANAGLLVVIDEAQRLWPTRGARPSRIEWIMQQINSGTPFGLVGLSEFFDGQLRMDQSGWGTSQIEGRIHSKTELPELTRSDLEQISGIKFPAAKAESIQAVAAAAALQRVPLGLIESLQKNAEHGAAAAKRATITDKDIRLALKDRVLPSIVAFDAARMAGAPQATRPRPRISSRGRMDGRGEPMLSPRRAVAIGSPETDGAPGRLSSGEVARFERMPPAETEVAQPSS